VTKFFLAAFAVLSLSIGSAYAQSAFGANHPHVTHWGPDYGDDGGAIG
jgi:hypothetical protein